MTDHPAAKLDEIEARLNAIDGAPWKYENIGQTELGYSPGGCNKTPSDYMVANIRGWGHLQYMGDTRGDAKAQAMQDANGEFIAHAPTDIRVLLDIARQAIALGDRDVVLEEAAKEAEDSPFYGNEEIAAAIRALQGKPSTRKDGE